MTTILLVDDDKFVLRCLEKTLLQAGYDVLTAGECSSGWDMFQAHITAIELAIFDLNMPDFDGALNPEAGLRLLARVLAAKPDLPVVTLTAYDEVGKAREALRIGARAYFVKGREQELTDLAQQVLSNQLQSKF